MLLKHPLHVDQCNAITYPAHITIAMMEEIINPVFDVYCTAFSTIASYENGLTFAGVYLPIHSYFKGDESHSLNTLKSNISACDELIQAQT
ncbi:hypothetical protein E0H82_05460 [Acinetobacter sp. ANC 4910]|uniref:hypothetical protein n=1 Tax=Acinetobacter sp. ANC 4910 TaxID=2529850 RepID=UPI00103CE1E8|nr:hypothetical protein [Acinetobacter sp. ANC 4910]TCB36217.1 hypothetical protein E0H82_05460 [Acinetobacter sp. ANC 4910]